MNEKISPLLLAIAQGHTNIAQSLIKEGADVNLANRVGQTPLHAAAMLGNLSLVRLLHSAGARTWEEDHDGKTLAHFAALSNNPQLIDFLKRHRVLLSPASKVKVQSLRHTKQLPQGTTPFHLASEKSTIAMMQKLVQSGCNVEAKTVLGTSALGCAAKSANKQAVIFFRDYRIMQNCEARLEAIQLACALDALPTLKELYRDGADVNSLLDSRGRTALHFAATFGSCNAAIFLTQQGAKIQKRDLDHKTPLDLAVMGKHLGLVRYFLQELESFDLDASQSEQKPYLHQACELGAVELAALFLEFGASIEKVDFQGMRPIHISAIHANYPLLRLLLAFGADVEAKTSEGKSLSSLLPSSEMLALVGKYHQAQMNRVLAKKTLIHTAVAFKDEKHLHLLSKVVDINAKDGEGLTPLHWATMDENLSMLSLLVSLGAKVDEKDTSGITPLQLAVQRQRDVRIVQFLLQAGAVVTVKDPEGNSLLSIISQLQDPQYAQRLFSLVLEYLPKTSSDMPTPELLAAFTEAKMGKFAPLFNLINLGYPLVNEKFSLLHMAVNELDLPVLQTLFHWFGPTRLKIDHQDAQGQTALHLALDKSAEITCYLLDQGADPRVLWNNRPLLQVLSDESTALKISPDQRRALFTKFYEHLPHQLQNHLSEEMEQAIAHTNVNAFFKAINDGYPVDAQLFLKAISGGSLPLAKILRQWFQCELESTDMEGHSPLHLAAIKGHADVATYLLNEGAHIDVKNSKGLTLLRSIADNKTRSQKALFSTIYTKIPKKSESLLALPHANVSDESCFQYLHSGYSTKEVSLLAAKADCEFTIRSLHTLLPEQIDLKAIEETARVAKAEKVLEYIKSLTSGFWCNIL